MPCGSSYKSLPETPKALQSPASLTLNRFQQLDLLSQWSAHFVSPHVLLLIVLPVISKPPSSSTKRVALSASAMVAAAAVTKGMLRSSYRVHTARHSAVARAAGPVTASIRIETHSPLLLRTTAFEYCPVTVLKK